MSIIEYNGLIHVKNQNNDVQIYPITKIQNVKGLSDALNDKVDKVSGKGLSTNDFTTAHKTDLETLIADRGHYNEHKTFTGNYDLITYITVPANKMCVIDAILYYNEMPPLGILLTKSNGSDYDADNKRIAKSEPVRTPYEYFLTVHGTVFAYDSAVTIYLYAKSSNNSKNNVALSYNIY